MTTVHARLIGDKALVPRDEFERLVELAGIAEPVEVQIEEEDLPTLELMRLTEEGGSFDFWRQQGEDIYSVADGEPV